MKIIEVSVNGQDLKVENTTKQVAGSVGLYAIETTYDSEWDDVEQKIVVFMPTVQDPKNPISVAVEDKGGPIEIPAEVLEYSGTLAIGIVGYKNSGSVKITTKTPRDGTNRITVFPATTKGIGKDPTEPTKDIWQDIKNQIGDLSKLNTHYKENLVGAINEVLASGGGSGGSAILSSPLTVSNPLGRYANEETIPAGTPLEDIIRGMLSKTSYPVLTNPSVSLGGLTVPSVLKVGAKITGGNAAVNYDRGSINPKYTASSAYRAGAATGYGLSITGSNADMSQTKATNQFTVADFGKDTTGEITVAVTATHEAGVQPKDSDGNDYDRPYPAGTLRKEYKVSVVLPFYYGVSDTQSVADFTGFTEDVAKKGNKTHKYDTTDQFAIFAYDKSYGPLKSILGPGEYEYIDGFVRSEITVDGFDYYVYAAEYATTDTGFEYRFIF